MVEGKREREGLRERGKERERGIERKREREREKEVAELPPAGPVAPVCVPPISAVHNSKFNSRPASGFWRCGSARAGASE